MVETGLDRLLTEDFRRVKGSRVGLVTNATGVTRDFRDNVALFAEADGVALVALFAPEHGMLGAEQAGAHVADGRERQTSVPIHSLYGERREPTAEQLADIDTLVFDIQSVGARYYTYLSTLRLVLIVAATHRRRVLVLDRPNPLGGVRIEGFPPFEEPEYRSFVACAPMPIRHGFTLGEFAHWVVARESLDVDLEVVPMEGWQRAMTFEETGLPWIAPSPNMPTVGTALVYPGTCLLEGTNVSEGRGTTQPFELIGAPWLDAYRLADRLNGLRLPGVAFRPTTFTPTFSKHANERCEGVQLHVTDADTFEPVRTGLEIVAALMRGWEEFRFRGTGGRFTFDRLLGTPSVRLALEYGASVAEIVAEWRERETRFRTEAEAFHLYA